jgi:RES domain-containing protein
VAHGARATGLSAPVDLDRSISVYRVARAAYPLFDGSGAARFGARWTSAGRPVVYSAGSYAGALLEILAHARRPDLEVQYRCLVIHIPIGIAIQEVIVAEVPDWTAADYVTSSAVGDLWLDRAETTVLRVPSITGRPHEHNYIINPQHRDARELDFDEPHLVVWDERLRR